MRLFSSDYKRSVDVGMGDIWYSIYSTVSVLLSDEVKSKIPCAIEFLKTGECTKELMAETKTQMETVRHELSLLNPDKAVYDLHKPDVAPPWKGNIAASVTSCANLYTTADGKDLFTEVIDLLEYGKSHDLSICAG